jgi:hypothetical protein
MNRRKFVVTSAVSMLVITIAVVGLAFYWDFAAKAFVRDLPSAVHYLPADSQAVFGMNVQAFVASPIYAQFVQKHEQEIATDLSQVIAQTGVDPRRDISYIIAAGRPSQQKGAGVVIAVGTFNQASITSFIEIESKVTPIKLIYKGVTVLMVPEANKLEKGIAFLSSSEIALGDLESLHAVIDVRSGAPGIDSNATLSSLLARLNPGEMFWFAGDPASVLSKAPANAPIPALSSIQSIFGTLNLTTAVNGKITVTAKDDTSAGQLADFARGLVALGNLAGAQNPDLAALVRGVQITQRANEFDVSVTIPLDLLQKMETAKARIKK